MQKIRKGIITQKGLSYFDYTASGQAHELVEREIQEILKTYANTHSEVSSSAIKTSFLYEQARSDLKKYLEIDDSFYLLPTGTGSTGAIKKLQELLGIYIPPKTRNRYDVKPKDTPLVLVGPYEHHSNEISFREGLCEVTRITLDKDESIDMKLLEETLEKNRHKEIIASFSVASNVTGVLSDYRSIYKLIKNYDGILCLDAATSSAYMNIDCNYYDAMFLSPHKLLGGVGSCGLLVIKKELCDMDKPTFAGGGTVSYVSRTTHQFLENLELREDAGTPGIIQFIRASKAYKLRNDIGLEVIKDRENELKYYFGTRIKKIEGIKLFCSYKQEKLPIFSLIFDNLSSYDASKYLSDKFNIQTRAGCSCAGPYGHDLLGLVDGQNFEDKPGWLRISIHYTHTKKQIDKLLFALKDCLSL